MKFEGYSGDLGSATLRASRQYFQNLRSQRPDSIDPEELGKHLGVAQDAYLILTFEKTGPEIERVVRTKLPAWGRPLPFGFLIMHMQNDLLKGMEPSKAIIDYGLQVAEEVCGYLDFYIETNEQSSRV